MLARLQDGLGCPDLTKQMVLIPARSSEPRSPKAINLLVGYNGSPRSQTALDLTLWIAHRTRLATGKQVTVQVVYVLDMENECQPLSSLPHHLVATAGSDQMLYPSAIGNGYRHVETGHRSTSAVAELPIRSTSCQLNQFDQADLILWQARHMADEWRGSLKTHLRFGSVATELRRVAQAESAELLLLGCDAATHPLVEQLAIDFPCAVLGIPPATPIS
ncbi:universal stress family protein [Stenomitos frigidus ULC18]|uniref:Universal stress family protein n=2 Tax=Stenomitos TaxID=1844270 RepID=A0A2T1E6U5_9CYAN|nr:universal stress family protein [Stenomitos frigidus ULC18]